MAIFAVFLACTGGCQKSAADTRVPSTGEVVSVGQIPTVTLRAGESTTMIIPVTVGEYYHIQSNPASDEFLIPLELHLEDIDGIRFGIPEYPAGRPHRLEGTDEYLMTYEGTVSVKIRIRTETTASDGEWLIKGRLSYQACDSRRCFFPASIPVAFKVVVSL